MKIIKSLILSVLFYGLFGTLGLAQTGKIDFTEFNLKNGLHVILHKDNSIPIVAIQVIYHVGSKNEKPDRTGFAHFFEHLMFEGSANIGRGEYFKYIENAGGTCNASTSFDITEYHETLPSNQLQLGLWLESERMLHLKIDSIGIETQRKVVKEEKKQRFENQPYGRLFEDIMKYSYTVHPYRWIPIGENQYIDKARYSEFMDFYNEYYVPQNAVLVVAGDINPDQAKAEIEKYFAGIPRGTREIYRPDIKEPQHTKEVIKTVYDNVQLPAVVFAYHTPAAGTPDAYALDMIQKWLTGGKSSELHKSLVDRKEIAAEVGAIPLNLEDPGLFIVYGIANLGKSAGALDTALNNEIDQVQKQGLSDHDFQKIRNQIENDFYSQNSTMSGIASNLAQYYIYYKNTNLINTEIQKYEKITKKDLIRVANQYLKPENRLVLYYLPESLKK